MAELLTPVRLGTSSNIDLSVALVVGNDKIDGVIVTQGMRILLKAQTDRAQNGIYVVQNTGYLTRATDFANAASIQCGTAVFIQEGILLENTGWVVNLYDESSSTSLIVGTDRIFFERFTVNLNLDAADISSAIVLRSVKGYPLTIAELDNNFKWLSTTLNQKLNISDFSPATITAKINSLTAETASLDAWELRGLSPTQDVREYATLPVRDENGNIYATKFHGSLIGNAATATLASYATLASNVDGIVVVANGGTGAANASGARFNLRAVGIDGDESMVGKLKLASSTNALVSLKITPGTNEPSDVAPTILENGDVWASTQYLRYYLNGKKQSIAHIDSPEFTGTPRAPTKAKETNTTAIATTQYVQYHVTDINSALNLKAPLASPSLTGTPTAPTVSDVTDNSTKIATTGFIQNRLASFDDNYYTKLEIDLKNSVIESHRVDGDTDLQNQINDLKNNIGVPVGSVVYFAANNVPLGYLKCDGTLVPKTTYSRLFNVIGYTYGGSGNLFKLPDLRGEFIRGFDDGRGVDFGRVFGTAQKGTMFAGKFGSTRDGDNDTAAGVAYITAAGDPTNILNSDTLTTEIFNQYNNGSVGVMMDDDVPDLGVAYGATAMKWLSIARPRNIAMIPCIKAFGVVDDPDQINAQSTIASISTKVNRSGDTMDGFLSLVADPTSAMHAATKQYVDARQSDVTKSYVDQADSAKLNTSGGTLSGYLTLHANPTSNMHAATKSYVDTAISNVPPNRIVVTSGASHTVWYTNIVGGWNDANNYFDVFPPAGKTMSNLAGFIASIWYIAFAGVVDGNDSLRCTYSYLGDRVRVYVQNTEQRDRPAASWLAIWS